MLILSYKKQGPGGIIGIFCYYPLIIMLSQAQYFYYVSKLRCLIQNFYGKYMSLSKQKVTFTTERIFLRAQIKAYHLSGISDSPFTSLHAIMSYCCLLWSSFQRKEQGQNTSVEQSSAMLALLNFSFCEMFRNCPLVNGLVF